MEVLKDGSKYWGYWNNPKGQQKGPLGSGFRIKNYETSEGNALDGVWYEWGYFFNTYDGKSFMQGHGICINSKGDRYEGHIEYGRFLCGGHNPI